MNVPMKKAQRDGVYNTDWVHLNVSVGVANPDRHWTKQTRSYSVDALALIHPTKLVYNDERPALAVKNERKIPLTLNKVSTRIRVSSAMDFAPLPQ